MEKTFVVAAICSTLYNVFIRRTKLSSFISIAALLILILFRAFMYKHFPIIGLFETLNFFAFFVLLINFLNKEKSLKEDLLCDIFVSILLAFSLFAQTQPSPFLPDSLKTFLFPVHVAFSFISYAFFTLAFFKAVLNENHNAVLELNYFGFGMFTIGLWAGGIWAFKAWGAYFLFSIKEIFSFVIWIYYAALVHARFFKEKSMIVKYGTILGFIIVMFTYIGIGLFMKNTHSL